MKPHSGTRNTHARASWRVGGRLNDEETRGAKAYAPTRNQARLNAGAHAEPGEVGNLLKRVWGIDASACPKCKGRMTAMAVVEDPWEFARYLAHAGETTVYPRMRGPPEDDAA